MRLEVITPIRVCVDREVARIRAEAPDGQFGMLPQHIDFVSELVPGILVYEAEGAGERFVAVNSGMLVKCGSHVRVAVRGAIDGEDLAELRRRVEVEFRQQNEEDRVARSALARLEATMIRRFRSLEGLGR